MPSPALTVAVALRTGACTVVDAVAALFAVLISAPFCTLCAASTALFTSTLPSAVPDGTLKVNSSWWDAPGYRSTWRFRTWIEPAAEYL